VTGATGLIGRSVMRALADTRHDAVAVVRDASGKPWRLGAMVDPELTKDAFGLVHLAWNSDPAKSEMNVMGSAVLFDQMRQAGVNRVVFVSSQSAGASRPTRYGRGKLAVESLLLGQQELSVRPGLVWSDPPAGTFARIVQTRALGRVIAARTKPILHPVHLDDIADILSRAAVSTIPSGVIEVGATTPLSMQALVQVALGEPASLVLPLGSLRLAGRILSLAGARGRVIADRLLGLNELERMSDPQDCVLGVKCRPLRRVRAPHGL